MILSVFSVFVWRARVEHESKSEAREHAAFYLRGREASTLAAYNTEYKKLAQYCKEFGKALCVLTEGKIGPVLIVIGAVTPAGVDVIKFKSRASASSGYGTGYGELGRVLSLDDRI